MSYEILSFIMNLHNVFCQNMEKMSGVDLINSSTKVKPLNTEYLRLNISIVHEN